MFEGFKRIIWDFRDPLTRFSYLMWIIRNIPGEFGMHIRGQIIPKYIARCGKNVHFSEGLRFRSIQKLYIGNNVRLGVNNFINAGGKVVIDDDVMLGPGVKIWSINHRYDDTDMPIYDQGYNYDPVTIKKGCWLGANVFVLPGVTLPEGCVVTACSLVSKKNYPPYSILAGNPCRVIGKRKS